MSVLGTILGTVSSLGAGSIASNAFAKFIPQNAGKIAKVGYFLGLVGLTGAAGEVAGNYVEKKTDEVVEAVKSIRENVKIATDENGEKIVAIGPDAVKAAEKIEKGETVIDGSVEEVTDESTSS